MPPRRGWRIFALYQWLRTQKSGRGREIVGLLDVGDDIGRLPKGIRRDRPQADGPVAAPAGAGHADDVELHIAAQRMPLKGIGDPGPDLLDGGRGLCKECLEIHVAFPWTAVPWRSRHGRSCTASRLDCRGGMVNGALRIANAAIGVAW